MKIPINLNPGDMIPFTGGPNPVVPPLVGMAVQAAVVVVAAAVAATAGKK